MPVDRDQIEREQAEQQRRHREREFLVRKLRCAIVSGKLSPNADQALHDEAPALLAVVIRIVMNSQKDQASRHQYADKDGTLAGCTMNLSDIDSAVAVLRKILID